MGQIEPIDSPAAIYNRFLDGSNVMPRLRPSLLPSASSIFSDLFPAARARYFDKWKHYFWCHFARKHYFHMYTLVSGRFVYNADDDIHFRALHVMHDIFRHYAASYLIYAISAATQFNIWYHFTRKLAARSSEPLTEPPISHAIWVSCFSRCFRLIRLKMASDRQKYTTCGHEILAIRAIQ